MHDPIHQRFVAAQDQWAAGFAAANPGLCEIHRLPESRFLVHYDCPTMRRRPGAPPEVVRGCDVGIALGPDYCRRFDAGVVTMLSPLVFHPNMIGGAVCLGHFTPATPIIDLLVQLYEMIVWKTFSPDDCLNPEAAQWARNHPGEVPLETGRVVRIPKQEEVSRA